jgi:hypothetical protein
MTGTIGRGLAALVTAPIPGLAIIPASAVTLASNRIAGRSSVIATWAAEPQWAARSMQL